MAERLVGRDGELAALRASRAAGRPGVVLTALPGLGRTAVLAAFLDSCRQRHVPVVSIRASATSRRLRFSALTPLLDHHFAAASAEAASAPITFDLVRAVLRARAAAGPWVLAVDDAHLLDDGSLRVIADAVGDPGTFVAVTVDETFRGLDVLTEHAELEVLTLEPLSPAAVAELVQHRTGAEPPDAASWWARSEGNPTVLHALLSDDQPDRADVIPGGLSPDARRLLSVLAFAEALPVDPDAPSATPAAELAGRGIVTLAAEGDRTVAHLRHAGQGIAIRHALAPIEARSARRAALEALRADWPTAPATTRLQLAALALESGVALTDVELLDVVALAPAAGDPRLALRLARKGVEQLGRFDDLRRLADVAHEQGEIDDVEDAIGRMSVTATSLADHAAVAVARSQHLLWRRADGAGAVAALDGSPAIELPELRAVRARLLATIGQAAVAVADAAPLRTDASPRVRMQAALAVAHGLRRLGEPTRAVAVLDEAIATAAHIDDPVLTVSAQVLRVARLLAMYEAGRWADAAAQSGSVVSYAERYDEAPGRAVALLVQGVVMLEAGAPAAALSPLDGAVELFAELAQPGGLRWSLTATALAHALCGDAAATRRVLDDVDAVGPHPADLFPSLEPRARAWARVTEGDQAGARVVLRAAIDRLRAEGALGPAGQCAHDLLSLDEPEAVLGLLPVPGEPLQALRQRHAVAMHARDTVELSRLTDDFEALGAHRWAAECAAALSHAAARAGSRDVARRAVDRLAGLRARCTGLDIPALTAGRMITLSPREREIALLASRGLSSKAIGDRLGLSVRTVDNHLARCFDKLGTRNRTELAELLRD
jgi:DNA-binding CsgD family transcriptional regulator